MYFPFSRSNIDLRPYLNFSLRTILIMIFKIDHNKVFTLGYLGIIIEPISSIAIVKCFILSSELADISISLISLCQSPVETS